MQINTKRTKPKLLTTCVIVMLFISIGHGYRSIWIPNYVPNPLDGGNLLAYTVRGADGNTSLMLYDPRTGVSTPIVEEIEFQNISFSAEGRIAFSSADQDDTEVYISDISLTRHIPTNISQNPNGVDLPLAWSPDGRFLAFESIQNESERLLYVWDGNTATQILSDELSEDARRYEVAWSVDNRLAITIWRHNVVVHRTSTSLSEIYLWDGDTTQNLSQNPTGEDRNPVWSSDGRLAFQSARNGEYDIFIWDGTTTKDGLPDKNSFTNAAPELTSYISFPSWTNDGQLAFEVSEERIQIYLWDGERATNISQNPNMHNFGATWSADGRWTFVTGWSREQLLYVRAANNLPLIRTSGQYRPAWSSSGYLLFCRSERPDWVMSMWDGNEIHVIARGYEIQGQWQGGGTEVICSSG